MHHFYIPLFVPNSSILNYTVISKRENNMDALPTDFAPNDHVKVKFHPDFRPYPIASNRSHDGIVDRILHTEPVNRAIPELGILTQLFIRFINPLDSYPILLSQGSTIFCTTHTKRLIKCIVRDIHFESIDVIEDDGHSNIGSRTFSIPITNIVSAFISTNAFIVQKI